MQELPTQAQKPPPESFFETYEARRESATSLLGFSLVYLTGYFTDPPAAFHPELVHALEDEKVERLLIIGFRGSGKSTFGSLALPLWAALEHPRQIPLRHPRLRFHPPGDPEHLRDQVRARNKSPHQAGLRRDQGQRDRRLLAPGRRNGTVLFPRTGCEELLGQIFNLGVASHGDLCDGSRLAHSGICEPGFGAAEDSLD
jgi:hypothetical protein